MGRRGDTAMETMTGVLVPRPRVSVSPRLCRAYAEWDSRATLADGDHLSLVCDGPEVFALVRTLYRTQPPRVPDDTEFARWNKFYDDAMAQARRAMTSDPAVRRRGSDALNRALWQANQQMCQLLGFAFYRGLWGQPLVCMFRPKEESVLL